MPEPDFCLTENCTWEFKPGEEASYSSTNFELAGFVLLKFAPDGKNTFDTFDLADMLDLDLENVYKNTNFPPYGVINEVGLTVPGVSLQFGEAEIWSQDQSIMGWTCGYAISSA